MRRKGLWRLLALLFAFTLIAAACGDDDDGGGESAGGGDGTTTTTKPSVCTEGGGSDSESTTTTGAGDSTTTTAGDSTTTTAAKSGQDETTTTTAADGGEATTTTAGGGGGGESGVFKVATLLPETGSLAYLGPPEFAGVDLAIQEINESGGVLGAEVPDAIHGDSGDTETDTASQTVDRELPEDPDIIVGTASSSVALTVIDTITGADVIMFSPANTAPDFTDYDDNGLYFRTAPSDVLQGQLLSEVITEEGNSTLGILARQDPYGEGLAGFLTESFEEGGGEVVESVIYDPEAQNYDAEVQQIVDAAPDAVAIVGFDESARIISSLVENDFGPTDVPVYGTDGNMGNALGQQFDEEGVLEGMRGTTPLTDLSDDFLGRLCEIDPELVDTNYAAEAYDAVMITALAANIAGTVDDPPAIAAEINGVTKDGEKCTTYADCLALVEAGTDIDYDGPSGPQEFSEPGEPTQGSYGILTFGPDNRIDTEATEFRFASL